MKYKLKLFIFLAIIIGISATAVFGNDISSAVYSINIDQETIKKGYEVTGFNSRFQLAIFPTVLNAPSRVELKNRTMIAAIEGQDKLVIAFENKVVATSSIETAVPEEIDPYFEKSPKDWKINSDIYEFNVRDKSSYDDIKPFVATIKYNNETKKRQKMFYFDGGKKEWISLPSTIIVEDKSVRAIIHLPYAKLAVFEHNVIPSIGGASWYKYKDCMCAASPDYPKGTKLKVTALYNNKSVIITVNDYGPERNIFPDRVIDLDVEAFKVLANKRAGVIDVKVEPVGEICSYAFQRASHPTKPAPQISAKYAIIIDEPTGEVLYKKEEKKKTSMASITKLMAANVFRDLKIDEENVIIYNDDDNLEGSRLYVSSGETMKIKDLFYSGMVGSANNAIKSLVRNSGKTEDEFIKLMNQKARDWELFNTEFKDPTGLDAENISTAEDIARLARKTFKSFEMLKATTITSYNFKTINTKKPHNIENTNKLVFDKDLYITGGKTGFLNEAGYCLVLKVKNKNDGREVIGVVLGESSSDVRFEDMKKLILWAFGDL